MKKILFISACILVCILISACRFKSPTIEEQREFATRGAFPAGSPSWVSKHHQLSNFPNRRNTGPAATTTAAELVRRRSLESPSVEADVEDARAKLLESSSIQQKQRRPDSPLARIAETCPGYDKSAEEALLTVDRAQRVAKYEWLVQRCTGSADIWTWLGRDYKSAGLNQKAKDAATRAYNIDSNHKAARDLLNSF